MTAVSDVVARLRASGSVFAEDEAELLIAESRTPEELESMIEQRVVGLPLEVIVGWAEFCGLRVVVEPGVFVPRKRTEVVVREAVAMARPGAVVVDLCCGTGAVGVAIHAAVGGVELHASDIEPAAVRCARRNVEPLGGALYEGDLFDPLPASLRGRVDLLVVNAPYVPTDSIALMPPEAREHEPHITLDGGADGVDIQRRIAAGAAEWLAPGGRLLIETSREQSRHTVAAFRAADLTAEVRRAEDVDGTVVIGGHAG
ncbi:MAG: release factor glutamine methyltransferase [Nocardioidaceae bacterium]|jgi:release factor glutamine methyltransferase|nr:release factor glutamine methyltransferase [Nocardioidaceae bacterium]